jgi:DNA primase
MRADLTDFIVSQFNKLGKPVFGADSAGPNMKTFCFTGHDYKTPSLSIHRMDGRFYCFGCGVKGRSWNDFANYIKVDTLTDEDMPDPFAVLRVDLDRRVKKALTEISIPWDVEPWTTPWRKIRPEVLKKVGALRWFDDANKIRAERILFPVWMYGEAKGWVARRTDQAPEGEKLPMPYRNAAEMSSKEVLFPLDAVISMHPHTVVLVEGPYDALRLVNFGIPALSTLGTRNYHPNNRIHIMNTGAERVIDAHDEDNAGKEARIDVALSLREMFDVEHFVCPEDEDPGSMPKGDLMRLWKQVHRKG